MSAHGYDLCGSLLLLSTCAMILELSGCTGPQSTLNPAGRGAEDIANLFWVMSAGAVIIWSMVVGLAVYAITLRTRPHDHQQTAIWVIGGGVIAPTVILTCLLIYGLGLLPPLLARAPAGSLTVDVEGHMWWWQVKYPQEDGTVIELANEIRIPVGQPVEFQLSSADVIHAFWIPALGGKMDMFPGRKTRLTLEPTRTGTFRGVCAEYCGTSHALMNFQVVVMEQSEFDEWLENQKSVPRWDENDQRDEGLALFMQAGCGACHSLRGTEANGTIGPDLTHAGSRLGIGADVLPNDADSFMRWISHTNSVKPEVQMPEFRTLTDNELRTLAEFLTNLK